MIKPPRMRVRLDGLKRISQYLNLSYQETRHLYKITVPTEERLPVFPVSNRKGKNCRLSAYVDELDRWLADRQERHFYRSK